MIDVFPLQQTDPHAVEALLDEAFGKNRHQRTAYRLRSGVAAIGALSFAAMEDGVLVGSIQCWPVQLTEPDGTTSPLILVGPVAVSPDRQRDGIGRTLTDAMLTVADETRSEPLVLIGDPEYYDRFFGFSAGNSGDWELPGPVERRRLLTRLRPGQRLPRIATLGPRIATALVQDRD